VPFLKGHRRCFAHPNQKNNPKTTSYSLLPASSYGPLAETAIMSGKENTALESNREKWLGEEKKQAGKNFRGAGCEKRNEKGHRNCGALGILSYVLYEFFCIAFFC